MKTLAETLRDAKPQTDGSPGWLNRPDDPGFDPSRVNCSIGVHDRQWVPCDDQEASEWFRKRRELDCANPQTFVCLACGDCQWGRCRTSSRSKCASCAARWLTKKQHEMTAALTSALKSGREMWVLTLTFPGFGGCKSYCGCHEARSKFGTDLAVWNGTFTERFNDLVTEIRRLVDADVQYERYLEPQMGDRIRDGRAPTLAFHGHTVLALELTSGKSLSGWSNRKWRKLLAAHGFGHSFKLRRIECNGDVESAVSYVTGYAKNVADELKGVPYQHPVTGERQPSKCRPFTSSRMFSETVAEMRVRFAAQKQRESERLRATAGSGGGAGRQAGTPCDGEAGALEALLDELRIKGMLAPDSGGF